MNNESLKKLSVSNYKFFCGLEGSDYIASEFALYTILKLIKRFKIERILEVGLGIGSISDTVLKYAREERKEIIYFGTEKNDFCLRQLQKNVQHYDYINLFDELSNIPNISFDLIIIDGLDESLNEIKNFTSPHCILFVEGGRSDQTILLKELFPQHLYVNVISLEKNKPYAHGGGLTSSYVGGGQLIFIMPTFAMKIFWVKQKLITFTFRKIRKLRKK